jgi:hypothetical protein
LTLIVVGRVIFLKGLEGAFHKEAGERHPVKSFFENSHGIQK